LLQYIKDFENENHIVKLHMNNIVPYWWEL